VSALAFAVITHHCIAASVSSSALECEVDSRTLSASHSRMSRTIRYLDALDQALDSRGDTFLVS
jgi:hypothetical protein